jgi:DNA repair protein RecO (recombination protein O)
LKGAHFQLLNQLDLVVKNNNKGHLNNINELKISSQYKYIPFDPKKQSVLLFLAEFLSECIREEVPHKELFNFIQSGILLLDELSVCADFHLVFLLKLSKYLGFYPQISEISLPLFNLEEGRFVSSVHNRGNLNEAESKLFKRLLILDFDDLYETQFNSSQRQDLLMTLVKYYSLHLNGFRSPKSLEVLKMIFS